jgi:hypothetical protein
LLSTAHRILAAGLTLLLVCPCVFAAEGVILVVKEVPDDFFRNAVTDGSVQFKHGKDTLTVVGRFARNTFSIPGIGNVTVYDAKSRQLQLRVERSSIYREFEDEDITQIRFAFEISGEALAAGPPKLEWGADVSADNIMVDRILIDGARRERYKTFTVEECASGEGYNPQVAELEVIVDPKADYYYLWYLLPMGVVFGLLALRKIYAGRKPGTPEE